ncbi:MAG: peptide chain release factor 1 [Patescibacteria group bacterium]|nr:peptide chain release factor 1 [Patescibacteria group bacterium]
MIDLSQIKTEYQKVLEELKQIESSSDWKKVGKLKKEKEIYEKIIETQKHLEKIDEEIKEVKKILITGKEAELISLAQEEEKNLLERKTSLENDLKKTSKKFNGEGNDPKSIIVEIRAGAGGEEAALFAYDLFNMYSKYSEMKNWQVKTLNSHRTELGGYKEISFQISGTEAFSKIKHEAGVHRVQRIPTTDKQGRIHTSTASVAVLAKPTQKQIQVRTEDLQIDTYRSSGPGGQNVNKRETAIRITHIPTGIVVASQNERNQLQNKENALSILQAKLLVQQEEKATEKLGTKRKDQIGQAKRSEKIRTYNFPQSRITDHRIKKTWHNLQEIMEGNLDKVIDELQEL